MKHTFRGEWKHMRAFWFHKCAFSGDVIVPGKKAFRHQRLIYGPAGENPVQDQTRWATEDAYIWAMLKDE